MARDYNFDESSHTYSRDSRVVPGCTRVLEHGGLVNYDFVNTSVMERKSRLGRAVHKATMFYDEGALDWNSLDDETKARTEAWADFRAKTGFVPRQSEFQCMAIVNGMEYGMQIDREGLIKKQDAIVEIKITADIMPAHSIQTAGYAMGLPMGIISSALARFYQRKRYAVQLLPTGKAKLHQFEDTKDAEVFLWALGITWWKLNKGLKLKEAV